MFGKLNQEIVGSHTQAEWSALVRQWKWRCFYCARPICQNSPDKDAELTKDHQLPISRGGTDFIWNIVPACRRCNLLKGNATVDEFRAGRPGVCGENPQQFTGKPMAEENSVIGDIAGCASVETATLLTQWTNFCVQKKSMYPEDRTESWYAQRRAQLRAQAQGIQRMHREAAGQMILPIFGDGAAKKLAESESATLPLKGMHVTERKA